MPGYAVVVTRAESNFSGYVPDLPGCIATGRSRPEVVRLLREAMEMHIQGLREDGLPVPPPLAAVTRVKIGRKRAARKTASSKKAKKTVHARR